MWRSVIPSWVNGSALSLRPGFFPAASRVPPGDSLTFLSLLPLVSQNGCCSSRQHILTRQAESRSGGKMTFSAFSHSFYQSPRFYLETSVDFPLRPLAQTRLHAHSSCLFWRAAWAWPAVRSHSWLGVGPARNFSKRAGRDRGEEWILNRQPLVLSTLLSHFLERPQNGKKEVIVKVRDEKTRKTIPK